MAGERQEEHVNEAASRPDPTDPTGPVEAPGCREPWSVPRLARLDTTATDAGAFDGGDGSNLATS